MIKRSNQQEDRTFINTYAPSIGAPKYVKQLLKDLKGEVDSNTVIGDFNIPHNISGSLRQKINMEK